MSWREDILVSSAARGASGDSGILDINFGVWKSLRLQLYVTAVTGTIPALDVVIEDTLDGTTFNTVGTFTQKTAPGRQVINIYQKENPAAGFDYPFANRCRVRWTIAGTAPSFTFSVSMSAKG